jgi:hypothetical protein
MTDRSARRMRRYAWWSLVQLTLVVVAFATWWDGAAFAAVLATLPIFWAWGHVQADVALNPLLDGRDRRRWRILLACLPGAMAVYCYRQVRLTPPAA